MQKKLAPDSITDFQAMSLASIPNVHLATTEELLQELDRRSDVQQLELDSFRKAADWLSKRLNR